MGGNGSPLGPFVLFVAASVNVVPPLPPPQCRVGIGYSGLVLSEEGDSAFLSHCLRGDRPVVELYVDPAGFSGR